MIHHAHDRSPLYAAAAATLTGLGDLAGMTGMATPAHEVAVRVGTSLVAGLVTWAVTQAATWLKNKLFPTKGQDHDSR